jgi:hypothetical protein
VKSPKSEWGGGGGGGEKKTKLKNKVGCFFGCLQKKTKLSNIFGWF